MLDYFFIKKDPFTKIIKWLLLIGHFLDLGCSFILFVMIFSSKNNVYGLTGVDVDLKVIDDAMATKLYDVLKKFIYEDVVLMGMFETSLLFGVLLDSGFVISISVAGYTLPVLRSTMNLAFSQAGSGNLLTFFFIKIGCAILSAYYAFMVWNLGPISLENFAKQDLESKERERQRLLMETDISRTRLPKVDSKLEQLTKGSTETMSLDMRYYKDVSPEDRRKRRSKRVSTKMSPPKGMPATDNDIINPMAPFKMPQFSNQS